MFCPIENQHFASDGLGRDQVGILRHIPSPVDFPIVIDLLDDLDSGCWGYGVATQLAAFIIVIPTIKFIRTTGGVVAFGNLNSRYLKVILRLTRGMSPK
jgi:hypothetical protein